MMQELSEVLKRHRHTMGRLVLVLGSGIPLRPDRLSSAERIAAGLEDWARDQSPPGDVASVEGLDPDPATAYRYAAPHFRDLDLSEGHLRLARLIKEGFFPTIVTLGVDDLLERALAQEHLHPEEQYNLVNVGGTSRREIQGALADSRRVTVVKALGTLGESGFAFTHRQVQSYLRRIERYLYDSAPATLIVAGYGERDSDLLSSLRREGGPIWWANPKYPLGDAQEFDRMKVEGPELLKHHELQPAVVELLQARRSERNVFCREAGTFDNFFHELYDRRVRKSRDRGERRATRDTITLEPEAPYRLIDAMEMRDSSVFHGRESEIEWLEGSLEEHRLVLVFGESGVGKTSLVTAGLAPRLAEEGMSPVLFRVGADPRREAVAALARAAMSEDELETIDESLTLPEAVRAAQDALGSRIVLILDQAEDLIARIGPRTREDFARQLGEVVRDGELDARVVMTVVDQGLPRLWELHEQLPGIYQRVLRLGHLSRSSARQVLVKAAARYERRWAEDLIDRILDDLGPNRLHTAELSLVCYRCYATLGRGRVVKLNAYESLGGAAKLLPHFLHDSLLSIPRREREHARIVLRALVRSGGAKGPLSIEQIQARCPRLDRERIEKILWMLADARLALRLGRDQDHRTYELVSGWVAPQVLEGAPREERVLREAEDAVARGLSDWDLFSEPLEPEVLRRIRAHRTRMHLTPDELALAVRSAGIHGIDADVWLEQAKSLGERELPLLADALRSVHRESVQVAVVERLDALGSDAAIRALLEALPDLSEAAASRARAALEKRGQAVAAAVRDTSGEDRARALEALGAVATPAVVEPLLEVVDDASEDASVREVAVSALESVAALSGGRASAGLIGRLAEVHSATVDLERATALARVVAAEAESPALFKAAESHGDSASLRYAAYLVAAESRDAVAASQFLAALERQCAGSGQEDLLASARGTLEHLTSRLDAGDFEWTMFRKDACHSGFSGDDIPTTPRVLWRVRTEGQVVGSPAISRDQCFFGAKDGVLRAVDLLTGRELWSRRLGPSIETSPAICDDVVIVGSVDRRVYACERRTGRIRWQVETDGEVRASATVLADRVLVATWAGTLWCLAPEDGKPMWRQSLGGPAYAPPAVTGDRAYVGSWSGSVACLEVEKGARQFDVTMRAEVNAPVTISDETVAAGSEAGEVVLFGLDDPKPVACFETQGAIRSAPLLDESSVWVASGDGSLRRFSRGSGEQLWRFDTDDPIVSSPAMTRAHIVFGSRDGALYAVTREEGEEVFRLQTPYSVLSAPALVDGVIYVGMDYYELHAIGQGEEAGSR